MKHSPERRDLRAAGEAILAQARHAAGLRYADLPTQVALRIGLAATRSHFMRGYRFQGTCGAFGAAATAAHMLHPDAEQSRHALGTAKAAPTSR